VRHFVIAAGMAGSGYDNFGRQYARIFANRGCPHHRFA